MTAFGPGSFSPPGNRRGSISPRKPNDVACALGSAAGSTISPNLRLPMLRPVVAGLSPTTPAQAGATGAADCGTGAADPEPLVGCTTGAAFSSPRPRQPTA